LEIFKFFSKEKKSKNVAKERLKLVLIHDRNNVSPILMENIKRDIIEVVSKYMEVDGTEMDLKLSRTKRDVDSAPISALVANIPIVKIKEGSIE
jgi:cell division topological specificity factor